MKGPAFLRSCTRYATKAITCGSIGHIDCEVLLQNIERKVLLQNRGLQCQSGYLHVNKALIGPDRSSMITCLTHACVLKSTHAEENGMTTDQAGICHQLSDEVKCGSKGISGTLTKFKTAALPGWSCLGPSHLPRCHSACCHAVPPSTSTPAVTSYFTPCVACLTPCEIAENQMPVSLIRDNRFGWQQCAQQHVCCGCYLHLVVSQLTTL